MKVFGKIAILLALMLLLLHSVVPHVHHTSVEGPVYAAAHSCESDLFGLIQFTFHSNPGENHLEEFVGANGYQLLHFDVVVEGPLLMLIQSDYSVNKPLLSIEEDPPSHWWPDQNQFRGPPTQA